MMLIQLAWIREKSVKSLNFDNFEKVFDRVQLPFPDVKIQKVIYGAPNIDEIETTDIENMNSIFRERLGRFVRKTKFFL